MPKHHHILDEILVQIRPSAVPSDQKTALNQLKQEVINFIQSTFAANRERAGDPVIRGSQDKGTDVAFDYDVDIFLPFRQNYRASPQAMKAVVYNTFKAHFTKQGTEVRDQRVSVGVKRIHGTFTMRIDIVPGMELSLGKYDPKTEEGQFLTLYDREANTTRTTNVARHARLLKEKAEKYRDTVRLLKAWRNKESHIIGSYALELLVYGAAIAKGAPASGNATDLLRHVLECAIPFLESDGELQDIGANYKWRDYLGKEAKKQLAGRWKKLLTALNGADSAVLAAFFKVN